MNTFISSISKKEFPVSEKVSGKMVRQSIMQVIQKDYPEFNADGFLAVEELNYFRQKHLESFLNSQTGELGQLEKIVLSSIKEKSTLSDKIDEEDTQQTTIGQRVADKVAAFGGSWTFIISFSFFLFLWITINIYWLSNKGFDPYPFILLNLILSCIAAMQAPVIMMSQNRQEEKDRERAKNDYMVNLKSELEIRMLHEKIDHLILSQQQEVLEVHKEQMEILIDVIKRLDKLDDKK
jgi:uncharacterized membrane protein